MKLYPIDTIFKGSKTSELQLSRNMVRRILRKHEKLRDEGHDILLKEHPVRKEKRAGKLDAYEETLKRLLEKYPRISGQRLFEVPPPMKDGPIQRR
ncbi:MAG: hypothetical protein WC405_20630 [Syntrophales bacterium]